MSVQHFKSLLFRSSQLQQEIEKEQSRRLPDWMRLLKLKKLRLAIKDRIEQIVREGIKGELQPARIKTSRARSDNWQNA